MPVQLFGFCWIVTVSEAIKIMVKAFYFYIEVNSAHINFILSFTGNEENANQKKKINLFFEDCGNSLVHIKRK